MDCQPGIGSSRRPANTTESPARAQPTNCSRCHRKLGSQLFAEVPVSKDGALSIGLLKTVDRLLRDLMTDGRTPSQAVWRRSGLDPFGTGLAYIQAFGLVEPGPTERFLVPTDEVHPLCWTCHRTQTRTFPKVVADRRAELKAAGLEAARRVRESKAQARQTRLASTSLADPIGAARKAHEAAVRAERKARLAALSSARESLGIFGQGDHFECSKCGRWANVMDAFAERARLLADPVGLTTQEWDKFVAESRRQPIRPAFMQRELGRTYANAGSAFEIGVDLGIFDRRGGGLVVGSARCATCLERRVARTRAQLIEESVREILPPQLRFRVLQRDAFRCQYCGRSARDGTTLHLDHVVPV